MKNKSRIASTLVSGLLLLAIAGCGSNVTNCLSSGDASGMLARAGYTDCGDRPPCGNQVATDQPIDAYVCAFLEDTSTCGAVDPNTGCNTYGHITGTVLTADGCSEKCYNSASPNIQIDNTHVACSNSDPGHATMCTATPAGSDS